MYGASKLLDEKECIKIEARDVHTLHITVAISFCKRPAELSSCTNKAFSFSYSSNLAAADPWHAICIGKRC